MIFDLNFINLSIRKLLNYPFKASNEKGSILSLHHYQIFSTYEFWFLFQIYSIQFQRPYSCLKSWQMSSDDVCYYKTGSLGSKQSFSFSLNLPVANVKEQDFKGSTTGLSTESGRTAPLDYRRADLNLQKGPYKYQQEESLVFKQWLYNTGSIEDSLSVFQKGNHRCSTADKLAALASIFQKMQLLKQLQTDKSLKRQVSNIENNLLELQRDILRE